MVCNLHSIRRAFLHFGRHLLNTAMLVMLWSAPVNAQSATENATTEADDAFGITVGNERVGLYSSNSVRGFSPIAANNIRIEELYFDQQGYLVYNAFDRSEIAVGLKARDYVLTNPSGVVNFQLRRASGARKIDATIGIDPAVSPYVSATFETGGKGKVGVAGQLVYYPGGSTYQGADVQNFSAGATVNVPLGEKMEIAAFAEIEYYQTQTSPLYYTQGAILPPQVRRGTFLGQRDALYEYTTKNMGVIAQWSPSSSFKLRAGLFRSTYDLTESTYDLIIRINNNGVGDRFLYAFPDEEDRSYSGEIQAIWTKDWKGVRLTTTASLRGRDVRKIYGDADVISLGQTRVGQLPAHFAFNVPNAMNIEDEVRQTGIGLHARLQFGKRFELGGGILKNNYRKTVDDGTTIASNQSTPLNYQLFAAWSLSPKLAIYASASDGLEETGLAPARADNRGDVLPAAITRQRELGFRFLIDPMTVTVSAFDLRKPYPDIDGSNIYRFVGEVRHRGIELSLVGRPVPALTFVGGLIFLDATVDPGTTSLNDRFRATGQPRWKGLVSLDWRLPTKRMLRVDASVSYVANRSGKATVPLDVPDYALISLGLRYEPIERLTVRMQIQNVLNTYAYSVSSTSAFNYLPQRAVRLAGTYSF